MMLLCTVILAAATFAAGAMPPIEALGPKSRAVAGDFTRFERVWQRAERGETIRLLAIGGSITEGAGATIKANRWAERFAENWRKAFPKAKFLFKNAGIGATGSEIGAFRIGRDVLPFRPDVVAVEFSVNDGNYRGAAEAYEGVLRQLLNAPGNPAIILLGMVGQTGNSAQAWHQKVAEHYRLPYVSYRDAVYPFVKDGTISWRDISPDSIHPNDYGHYLAAGLLDWTLRTAYADFKASGRAAAAAPAVREPLFGTTYDHGEFKRMDQMHILENKGFFPLKDRCWGEGLGCTNADGRLVFDVEASTLRLLYRVGNRPYNWGKVRVSIDGRVVNPALDCFRDQWWWFTPSLQLCRDAPGHHVVEIVTLPERNPSSKGYGCHLTGVLLSGSALQTKVDASAQ